MANSIRLDQSYPTITQSDEWYERAKRLIPSATQTLAKGPTQHVNGVAPKYLMRGEGCHVWDVDGNEYIDLTMGVGPLSLGYRHPEVDAAIRAQLDSGITFSLMHPLEVEVAELVQQLVPSAERVRFSKTGADATSAAVRLARAFTGRDKVLCCGYHGWHDWYIGVTTRNAGVPQAVRDLVHTFDYNDLASVDEALDHETACVILEPVAFTEPTHAFLEQLKALCRQRGALLIFDEMWTGFRLALGGAQEFFEVTADLVTYSKAIANGMPISVLAGRADVMSRLDEDVFFYTTFGGEALSLAATRATLEIMRKENVPTKLAQQGAKLRAGYNELVSKLDIGYSRCVGYPSRSMVTFEAGEDALLLKSYVQQELIKRGVLWSGFHNMSLAHRDEDIAHVLAAYREVLPLLARAVAQGTVAKELRGERFQPVFRRTEGFNTKPRRPS